jgi:hypothetical protein
MRQNAVASSMIMPVALLKVVQDSERMKVDQQEGYTSCTSLDLHVALICMLRHLLCQGTDCNFHICAGKHTSRTRQQLSPAQKAASNKHCYTADAVTIACCCSAVAGVAPTSHLACSAPAAQMRHYATAEHARVFPTQAKPPTTRLLYRQTHTDPYVQ